MRRIAGGWMAAAMLSLAVCYAQTAYDVVLRNGRIVDGTGAPWYRGDVGVRAGKIAAIGRLEGAGSARVIDVRGMVVAPGFIDMMGQTAAPFLKDRRAAVNLLTQGITTINCGEGASDAPLSDVEGRSRGWRSMREYFAVLERAGLPMNAVQTVGTRRCGSSPWGWRIERRRQSRWAR